MSQAGAACGGTRDRSQGSWSSKRGHRASSWRACGAWAHPSQMWKYRRASIRGVLLHGMAYSRWCPIAGVSGRVGARRLFRHAVADGEVAQHASGTTSSTSLVRCDPHACACKHAHDHVSRRPATPHAGRGRDAPQGVLRTDTPPAIRVRSAEIFRPARGRRGHRRNAPADICAAARGASRPRREPRRGVARACAQAACLRAAPGDGTGARAVARRVRPVAGCTRAWQLSTVRARLRYRHALSRGLHLPVSRSRASGYRVRTYHIRWGETKKSCVFGRRAISRAVSPHARYRTRAHAYVRPITYARPVSARALKTIAAR